MTTLCPLLGRSNPGHLLPGARKPGSVLHRGARNLRGHRSRCARLLRDGGSRLAQHGVADCPGGVTPRAEGDRFGDPCAGDRAGEIGPQPVGKTAGPKNTPIVHPIAMPRRLFRHKVGPSQSTSRFAASVSGPGIRRLRRYGSGASAVASCLVRRRLRPCRAAARPGRAHPDAWPPWTAGWPTPAQ